MQALWPRNRSSIPELIRNQTYPKPLTIPLRQPVRHLHIAHLDSGARLAVIVFKNGKHAVSASARVGSVECSTSGSGQGVAEGGEDEEEEERDAEEEEEDGDVEKG